MNFLKKATMLVLVLAMFAVLAACSGTAPAAAESETSEASADEQLYIGFVQIGAESDWRMANTKSMQDTFTQDKGYKFEMVDCQQQTRKQITAIRDFIQKGVDYIVLAPNTEAGWDTVLGEAKEAAIPVIIVDRMIDTEDENLFKAWVGSDFKQEGYDAVTALATVLYDIRGISRDEEINIVTLQGTMDSTAQIGRTNGFEEKMADYPNWKMLDRHSGDFTQERGQEVMKSFLMSYEDIDVVIAENDNMAFGAIAAIEAAGKTCGSKGDIVMLSFDAVKAAFEMMIAGKIDVDVECNPLHGPRVEGIIQALEAGKKVEKILYVTEETFYAADAERIMPTRAY